MFGTRRNTRELMDDLTIADGRIDEALNELSVINRCLGGHRVSRLGVSRIIRSMPIDQPVSILDVGAGGSDLSQVLAPLGRQVDVTALDASVRACDYARKHGHPEHVVVGSAHALPFGERSFDIAHVSLFLHHCTDEEARALLANLSRVARYGVVINDLRRHPLAYAGIYLLTRLLSRSTFVRHDGPLSVLRAFSRSELVSLLPSGPGDEVSVTRHWAFRWCVCIALSRP